MSLVVVIPVGDIGARYDMVIYICRPGIGYLHESGLYGCEVHTRATLNNSIESVVDIVDGLKVVVSDSNGWLESILKHPP